MNIFPFTSKDLVDLKMNPKEGDEVEFNVVIKKRQGRKRATNVSIIKEAPETVEHGVVASVHKSYGHIVCLEREEDMFFHFTDVFDNQPDVKPEDIQIGMELEFRVIIDPRNHKKKAVNIKILPKGSICSETILPDRYHGVVFRESRPGQGQTSFGLRRRDECGLVDFDDPSKGAKETLPFINLDLSAEHQRDRVQLWPGDEIEFSIGIGKKTQQRYATRITRIKSRDLPREKGTVSSIKNYFGFLSSPSRDDEIYFHFSELEPIMEKKDIEKLRVGHEFEYSIARDSWADNKPIAVMLKSLPKKTNEDAAVAVDRDSRYYGTVEREPKKRGNVEGRISMKPNAPEEELIAFDFEDVDKKFSLRKGDRVEFSFIASTQGSRRATGILLMKQSGTVGSVKGANGIIVAEDKSIIHFAAQEVQDGVTLGEGDVVEFLRVFNSRNKDFHASEIKRTEAAPPKAASQGFDSPKMGTPKSQRKVHAPITSSGSGSSDHGGRRGKVEKVYMPKVADSGPAFGSGRGRPTGVTRTGSGSVDQ